MLAADDALTFGGILAVATLMLSLVGLVASLFNRTAIQRERLTRLETMIESHLDKHHAARKRPEPKQDS